MAFPTRRQAATHTRPDGGSSKTDTFTFSQSCLTGNAIVVCLAGDKNTGSMSVTDNTGSGTWNVTSANAVATLGQSVSTYIFWKVAVGGETVITTTGSGSGPTSGNSGYAEEIEETGNGAWTVVAKDAPDYPTNAQDTAATRQTITLGPTDTADYDGRALAVAVFDSVSNSGRSSATFDAPSGFTKIFNPPASVGETAPEPDGFAGCWVASKNVAQGQTASTTFDAGGSDQLNGAILVLGRVATVSQAPNVSAGPDVSITLGDTFTYTATVLNNGSAITEQGWEVISGPASVGASNAVQNISFEPTVAGLYELEFHATNAGGTSSDTMILTVTTGSTATFEVTGRLAPSMRAEASSHTLSTPSTAKAGDAIFIWTSTDEVAAADGAIPAISSGSAAAGWVTQSGWTAEQGTSTNVRGTLFYLPEAQGGGADQLVINFPASVSEPCAYTAISISAADTPVVGTITSVGGTTSVAHTPSAISGLTSNDYLSLLFIAIDANNSQHDVSPPAGYGGLQESEPPSVESNAVMAASMDRLLTGVTSVSPGDITWTGGDQSIAIHVAVPKGAGGPPPDPGGAPIDVVPISRTAGYPHYGYDVARPGSSRELYEPSQIESGLTFDPEFKAVNGWLQAAVYENADTTSGSSNPRSEGRETQPGSDSNLGWNHLDGGTHWQRFRARVVQHPLINNVGISVGQLHSLDDDVLMIRTRMEGTSQNTLVLRELNPNATPEPNAEDILTLDANYSFNKEFDILLLVRGGRAYVFYNDFLIPVHSREVTRFPFTGTYMYKWGCYIQGTSSWPDDSLGIVQFQNVQHWHTGWANPINYYGCPVVSLGSAGSASPGQTFSRSMSASGTGITEYKWSILSGPAGVGTQIGNAATLNWTPTTLGSYVLMGGAKNAKGWSDPTFLDVTVESSPGTLLRNPRIGVDKIALRLSGGSGPVRINFSLSSGMTSVIESADVVPDAQGNAHVPIPSSLTPDTVYYFRAYRGGSYLGSGPRSFRTLPGSSQTTAVFGFSSCRQHGDDAPILNQLAARNARLFLHLGDAHYQDINSTNVALYRSADDEQYDHTAIEAAYTSIPNTYTWSNHDYCGENSTASSTGKNAVRQAFRERVPTPTLPESGGIYHTFKFWGDRVRFIVLDTRSYRDPIGTQADGTMLGSEQLSWLQGLLASPDTALTFVVSAEGWHSPGSDNDWGYYQNERSTIAGWITSSDTEVVFLCGDWHYLAYATAAQGTPGGVHVWHAAALRQYDNGDKGGPFVTSPSSQAPAYTSAGQMGFVTLNDTGSQITATFTGARQGTSDWGGSDTVVVSTSTSAVEPGRFFLGAV